MQTSDYRWDDLRLVLSLYRRGSLKAAAAELGVNISTVARRLDALEASMARHLFDRSPDGTHPTAAAEQLLPFAEMMERAAMGVANALDGLEAEPEGVVRVTAPPGFVDHFLAPAIGELIDRHPKLRIEILSSIGYADLTRRQADLALRAIRPTGGDLVATRLLTADYTLIAAPRVAADLGRLRRLDDARWITYSDDLGHLPEVAWVTDQVDADRIVMRTNSLTGQLSAIRSGLGVKLEVKPFLEVDGLAEVAVAPALRKSLKPMPEAALWLVGHRALRDVPRIAAVWSFLEERFRAGDRRYRGRPKRKSR